MGLGDSEKKSGNCWQISAGQGEPAVLMELAPNSQLRQFTTTDGDGWETTGEQACFKLGLGEGETVFVAGWYELRGKLETIGGEIAEPSLYLKYAGRSTLACVELMLPKPNRSGRVDALLMCFDDVKSMMFFPGRHPLRFRMRDFSMRRISRLRALYMMLGVSTDAHRVGRGRRAVSWVRTLVQRGLKRATDALYADYNRRIHLQGGGEYAAWIRKYDTIGHAELAAFRQRALTLSSGGPLMSLLLCVRDEPDFCLRRCLDSALRQAWEHWEICVADNVPSVSAVLAEYAANDSRIRVVASEQAALGESSVVALADVRGAFIVPFDSHCALRPHALLCVAEAVAANPGLAILYSDEDEIDGDGNRSRPNFKPDWNPDLLRSKNYVGHLVVVRTTLAREAGGFQAGGGNGCDYELILRCSEKVAPRQICHIPEILYHRPVDIGGPADKARGGDENSGVRSVAEHLRRLGSSATVQAMEPASGLHRIHWPISQPAPKISLIIPTRDRVGLLRKCVESILTKSTYPEFELVVVDNRSRDRTALAYLRELSGRERVRVLHYDAPFNYSAINNWAARQCKGQLVGLVNNDVEVISPDWLEEMAGLAMRSETGVVGAMLYYPDDTIQHAGMLLGMHGVAGHAYVGMPRGYTGYVSRALVTQNLTAVTGACLLVRREVFEMVGGLDEQLPVEFNDVDFCLRVQKHGYRNVWTPFAELYHHESASRAVSGVSANDARREGVAFMRERWGDILCADPAYNPNLSLQSADFELAFPPRAHLLEGRTNGS